MKIRGVDYVFYNVSNLKKSIAFYRDVLGLKLTMEQEKWAEFETSNLAIAIGEFGEVEMKTRNNAGVALAVENVADALKELEAKNVKVAFPLSDFPPCEMAIIEDIDGNQILLHHRKDGTVG